MFYNQYFHSHMFYIQILIFVFSFRAIYTKQKREGVVLKIEIWSDYVCPFCYIGKKELERALKTLGLEDKVDVELKSYILDPTTPEDSDETVYSALSKKYSMSEAEVKKMTQNVVNRAKEVGLEYDFDNMKNANTFASHRLVKWAETQNKAKEFSERLFQVYFLEGQHIGKREVLLKLIEEVGLNREEAKKVLNSTAYTNEVNQDINEAMQLGVRGVPFFVINQKYGISGAQPQAVFKDNIEKVAKESGLLRKVEIIGEGSTCSDDSCEI